MQLCCCLLGCSSHSNGVKHTGNAACLGNEAAYYDEAYTKDGVLRPAYVQFEKNTGVNALQPSEEVSEALAQHPMGDRYRISSVPLILESADYRRVAEGTAQRARAYAELFKDLIWGDAQIVQKQILPREVLDFVVPPEALQQWRSNWQGKTAQDVNFFYGPDLMRDVAGQWWVIEDNIGANVGGFDDIGTMSLMLRDKLQLGDQRLASYHTGEYVLETSIRHFLERHQVQVSEAVGTARKEAEKDTVSRMWKIGFSGIVPRDEPLQGFDRAEERIYHHYRNLDLQVVPTEYLRRGGEVSDMPQVKAVANLNWEAQSPEWNEAALRWMHAPDIRVLMNKALLPYVEEMIRYYLQEDPILHTQPSSVVHVKYGQPHFEIVEADAGHKTPFDLTDFENIVLKVPDESGGFGVAIGRYQNIDRWLASRLWSTDITPGEPLLTLVAQRYLEPSRLLDYIVDVRPLCHVAGADQVTVSHAPWGRRSDYVAMARDEDAPGFTNTSQGAFEMAVWVEK